MFRLEKMRLLVQMVNDMQEAERALLQGDDERLSTAAQRISDAAGNIVGYCEDYEDDAVASATSR